MNPPPSPSIPDEVSCYDISTMIGERIQVQWNMSDGSLEWFDAIVQSCSSEEAVVVYEDGDSYLLEMYGETEWRPFPEKKKTVTARTTDDTEFQNTSLNSTSARATKSIATTTKPRYNDSMTPSFSTKAKSPLSLRSLIGKLTGTSLCNVPSPTKKNATTNKEQTHESSRSSFSEERTAMEKSLSAGTASSVPDLLEEASRSIVTKDSPRKRRAQQDFSSSHQRKKQKLPSSLDVPQKILGFQEECVASLLHKKTLSEKRTNHQYHQKKLHSFQKHSFKRHSFMKRLPPPTSRRIGALTKAPMLFDPKVENEALYFY